MEEEDTRQRGNRMLGRNRGGPREGLVGYFQDFEICAEIEGKSVRL